MSNAQYSHERWHRLINQSLAEIRKLGELKGGEYAGDVDRLANFRRNGERLGLPMETIWGVYAGKHWDAISQFITDSRNGKNRERLEPIHGRVDDLLVYLLLFKAMLDERGLLPDTRTDEEKIAAGDTFGVDMRGRAKISEETIRAVAALSGEEYDPQY